VRAEVDAFPAHLEHPPLSRSYRRSGQLRQIDPEDLPFLDATEWSTNSLRRERRGADRGGREPASFRCVRCSADVPASAPGTAHRNHCPVCLWSRHVDDEPGDRRSDCHASMEPIAITVRGDEWVLIHRCGACGELSSNRIAGDDSPLLLMRLALRPLAQPPFPLERLGAI
jgi:DNA-directed RNA polymerase subunit RPC12/RpoP